MFFFKSKGGSTALPCYYCVLVKNSIVGATKTSGLVHQAIADSYRHLSVSPFNKIKLTHAIVVGKRRNNGADGSSGEKKEQEIFRLALLKHFDFFGSWWGLDSFHLLRSCMVWSFM